MARLTIRGYARHRGVSHTAVRKALAAGRITAGPDGSIDPVLADQEWQESSLYIFARSWKGIGINLLRMPTAWLNHQAQEFLNKTSLLVKVKRLWRDRIMKPGQPGTVGGVT